MYFEMFVFSSFSLTEIQAGMLTCCLIRLRLGGFLGCFDPGGAPAPGLAPPQVFFVGMAVLLLFGRV